MRKKLKIPNLIPKDVNIKVSDLLILNLFCVALGILINIAYPFLSQFIIAVFIGVAIFKILPYIQSSKKDKSEDNGKSEHDNTKC